MNSAEREGENRTASILARSQRSLRERTADRQWPVTAGCSSIPPLENIISGTNAQKRKDECQAPSIQRRPEDRN